MSADTVPLPERADLYDEIVCRIKFEPLTRSEQYAQIDRAVAAERERCARAIEQYGGAWDVTTQNFARVIRGGA